jgi:hypothetical protein
MNRAHTIKSVLALACMLSSACDEQAGVEEVDRGAKPIEARRAADELFLVGGVRVEIVDVQLVATGTVDGQPLAMLAGEDGTPVLAVVGKGASMRWVDVEALIEGHVVLLDARPPDADADAAAVLEHLAVR